MNLRSERLILRHPVTADSEIMMGWENDPEIWEKGDNRRQYSMEEIIEFIESGQDLTTNCQERLMICPFEIPNPIGCIDLYDYDGQNLRAGVGILIYEKNYRRMGFAQNALQTLIRHSKDNLHLKQLYCHILEDNLPSLALFKKEGFEITGLKKSWRRKSGGWKDEYMLQLILNN